VDVQLRRISATFDTLSVSRNIFEYSHFYSLFTESSDFDVR
jgi:hypothetical protein